MLGNGPNGHRSEVARPILLVKGSESQNQRIQKVFRILSDFEQHRVFGLVIHISDMEVWQVNTFPTTRSTSKNGERLERWHG